METAFDAHQAGAAGGAARAQSERAARARETQLERRTDKAQLLQDPFLNVLRREKVPVLMYLVNGIKLQGTIVGFDQYVILLLGSDGKRPEPTVQMVYKHAMSTIVPSKKVKVAANGEDMSFVIE